jgi:ADP-L-glycero-D-manno-heptose 6-epimerase
MKKICVTGNNGFIGKALQIELENQGFEVKGLEKWIFDRVRYQDRLIEYLHDMKPDVVFHVGACSDTQNFDVNEMMKLNVQTTSVLMDYCQSKRIPVIYSSSASCYGVNGMPNTLYSWSKYLGEEWVSKCGGVSLRYFNVYGEGEYHKGKMSSIAYQMYIKHINGVETKLFPIECSRDFVYIKDVVSANIHAMNTYEEHKGGYYDVGSGASNTFESVLNYMDIPFTYTSKDDIPNNYQTFTQADERKFLKGWNPNWSLEKGLSEYKAILQQYTKMKHSQSL